jgi:hypothetical protein
MGDVTMDTRVGERPVDEQRLDGNAVAGQLAVAFGGEMTDRLGRCAHCGTVNAVGALHAYVRAPGTVLRCPVCEGVVIRVVETDREILVDARGVAYLRLPRSG